ncbi:hypothetical protein V8G54_020207 [Vigna mungo]|uniref:Reverse transcriptase Ty1/copia-type domain-containing protein n=1 Tax=Vigna mungo TaxID=3915 RepID=A0AAQ3ND83_VIGMU
MDTDDERHNTITKKKTAAFLYKFIDLLPSHEGPAWIEGYGENRSPKERGIEISVSYGSDGSQRRKREAERKHRHITETDLAMLFHSHLPAHYWLHAFCCVVYVINRLPTTLLNGVSPFETLYNTSPNYAHFHPFGCRVYPCLCDYATNKLSPRSASCIFLGYNSNHKGFQCLDPSTSQLYVTRHDKLDKLYFPCSKTGTISPISGLAPAPAFSLPLSKDIVHSPTTPCGLCPAEDTPSTVVYMPDTQPQIHRSVQSTHPMVTRAKSSIFRPRHFADITTYQPSSLLYALITTSTPKGFKSATIHPGWLDDMHKELLDLVPRPSNTNIVGSKWVFRTKYLSDGLTQTPGLDYDHTFSPVVKVVTVRVILTLTVMNNWPLHQLDVNNALLNGHLTHLVYMEQPPGFVDPRYPNHVCRLRKALYGLKQTPLAWFQRFSSFLLSLGFLGNKADPSLFVYHKTAATLYIVVYVDDIILTGNNNSLIQKLLARFKTEFAIKDLGHLNYFLGLEVHYTTNGVFLSQTKYAQDILSRAQMLDAKPTPTPLQPHIQLTTTGDSFSNPTQYRSLVGALQYLTITRPDLSYAVNLVSQFLQAPTNDHFQAVNLFIFGRYLTDHNLGYRIQSGPYGGLRGHQVTECLEGLRRNCVGQWDQTLLPKQ